MKIYFQHTWSPYRGQEGEERGGYRSFPVSGSGLCQVRPDPADGLFQSFSRLHFNHDSQFSRFGKIKPCIDRHVQFHKIQAQSRAKFFRAIVLIHIPEVNSGLAAVLQNVPQLLWVNSYLIECFNLHPFHSYLVRIRARSMIQQRMIRIF